jgi:hypothetical protein
VGFYQAPYGARQSQGSGAQGGVSRQSRTIAPRRP